MGCCINCSDNNNRNIYKGVDIWIFFFSKISETIDEEFFDPDLVEDDDEEFYMDDLEDADYWDNY